MAANPFSCVAARGIAAPGSAPPDPLTESVMQALQQPQPQRTWLQSVLLLGVTLIAFAAAGFLHFRPLELALLVAVVLFHESGHYLGMRLFNYQDVRMFFIPFFGAAVAGRATSVEGWKEAIVILLGPLPGILLGIGIGVVCMFHDSALLRTMALMLIVLNTFNLLPLLPLDGGRLVHLILFSRQRHLEALFRVVAALLLGLAAWGLSSWILAIPAFFTLFGTLFTFRVSRLAQQLRGTIPDAEPIDLAQPIPRQRALPMIDRVRQSFPDISRANTTEAQRAKTLATIVRQVWERMHVRPPGFLASVILLAIYGAAVLAAPTAAIVFAWPIRSIVTRRSEDGTVTRVQELRRWGVLQQSTELGQGNRFHGRHVEFDLWSGRVKLDGSYQDGRREGIWTQYDAAGQIQGRWRYERGRMVRAEPPP